MIEGLVQTLRILAAPADPRRPLPSQLLENPERTAMDFADALRLATDCPQLELSRSQRSRLERLDQLLDEIGAAALWQERDIRTEELWRRASALAREAMEELEPTGESR